MKVVITGGCGFLGALLSRELLRQGALSLSGRGPQALHQITLLDRVAPVAAIAADPRIHADQGDLVDQLKAPQRAQALLRDVDLIVHLSAAVSAECEADFELGLHSNLLATQLVLEAARAEGLRRGQPPTVVFASSVAVFGKPLGEDFQTPPDDDTLPTPQSSYGIQKFIGEQLMADYGRKGFIRARSVRLMTVSVRPGRPNGAASGFLSGMIREPLNGETAVVPVPPETRVALSSPQTTLEGLCLAAQASDADWGPRTAMNLPACATTVGAMAQALAELAGPEVAARLQWVNDPSIARVVGSWPGVVRASRAQALGLQPDPNAQAIVSQHMQALANGVS